MCKVRERLPMPTSYPPCRHIRRINIVRIFMRRQMGIVGVIVIGLCTAVVVQAGDQKNAATWYRRAIKAYESLPTDVKEALWNYDWSNPNAPITAEFRLALARVQPVLRLAHRGARQGYSDFDLDYAQGVDLTLPHLQSMRGITWAMHNDALMRLRDGDSGPFPHSIEPRPPSPTSRSVAGSAALHERWRRPSACGRQ